MLAALQVVVWLLLAGFVALMVVVACWEVRDARRAVDRWRARRAARRARAHRLDAAEAYRRAIQGPHAYRETMDALRRASQQEAN
jgi:membrane protein required for beta-lactamase induction